MWWPYDLLQENRKRYQIYLNEINQSSSYSQSDSDITIQAVRGNKMQDSESELHNASSDESLSSGMPIANNAVLQVCKSNSVTMRTSVFKPNLISSLQLANSERRFR